MTSATRDDGGAVTVLDWPANEHIGTAPLYSDNPVTVAFHGPRKRVATRYYYRRHWPACESIPGFRMRPKFQKHLSAVIAAHSRPTEESNDG